MRRIDHICEARSSSRAAPQGRAGGPSTVRSDAAVRRASCGIGSGSRGELEGRALDVLVVDRRPGEAELGGARAVDALAEERQRRRRLARSRAPEQGAVAAARVEADRQEARDDAGLAPDDAQVGGEHEVEARPHGAAAHRRDRRRLELTDARERAVDRADPRVGLGGGGVASRLGERGAVAARAEEAARAADHHGADRRVGVELLAGGHELVGHRHRERVAPLGRVQAEHRHAVAVALDRDLAHAGFRAFMLRRT